MNSIKQSIRDIKKKYEGLVGLMDERLRRLWAASEAKSLGHGGITIVCKATKMSRTTIAKGLRELEKGIDSEDDGHIRKSGGGRKTLEAENPELLVRLERLVAPVTRGDPQSPLRRTSKSTRKLATELKNIGFKISPQKVGKLLRGLGYSLQSNLKSKEGRSHPDRDAQFEHINRKAKEFMRAGQPVISVDTKKKELIGDFKNSGQEWHPEKSPEKVRVHDFKDKELGKAIPYGVYDLAANEGFVSVGIAHDTAEFAVETIRRWWRTMGQKLYPDATKLLITADAGGSNAHRTHAWKYNLQLLSDETGLKIVVRHYPPGTSKWNKIEHRMWSYVTMNWRGRPLTSLATVVSLISNTTTSAGLRVKAKADKQSYPLGQEVSKEEREALDVRPSTFHGDWNYAIHSRVA